jgi:hypothetical protein
MGELKAIVGKNKVREEQLRRERAAEAKRKKELMEKRKKMKKIRFVAVWTALIFGVLTGGILLINGLMGVLDKGPTDKEEITTEVVNRPVDTSVYVFTSKMYKYEHSDEILNRFTNVKVSNEALTEKIDFILEHKEAYPENLLKLVAKCPDAIDFALEYPFKKGDDTLVVDLSAEYAEGEIPYLMQWDSRWGYVEYGVETIALDGCGPTCLSMVAIGLTGNTRWTPIRIANMAMENEYYVEGKGTAWKLMHEGCEAMGLTAKEVPLAEEVMSAEVNAGRPIIASMAPGDFTDAGHFIVIVGYKDGLFYVNDPNSKENTQIGWPYERIKTQIKNMWSYKVAE